MTASRAAFTPGIYSGGFCLQIGAPVRDCSLIGSCSFRVALRAELCSVFPEFRSGCVFHLLRLRSFRESLQVSRSLFALFVAECRSLAFFWSGCFQCLILFRIIVSSGHLFTSQMKKRITFYGFRYYLTLSFYYKNRVKSIYFPYLLTFLLLLVFVFCYYCFITLRIVILHNLTVQSLCIIPRLTLCA